MARGRWNLWSIARLRRIVRNHRPRLIHSHMVHANLLTRVTRPLSGSPPLVSTSHNINEGGPHRAWALRLTDSLSTRTTHVSRLGLSQYLRHRIVKPERAVWIPNGIDLDRFRPSESRRVTQRKGLGIGDEHFLWLSVASLTHQKALDRLLLAFARLPGIPVLAIAGTGPESSNLRGLARRLGVQDRVLFLGVRSDPEALMNAADAFVLSSRWEGLPLVLMEAAASGLPIVATNVGGCRELVEAGATGILVSPSPSASELSDAMRSLIESSANDRRSMGSAGRSRMAEYEITRIVYRWRSYLHADHDASSGSLPR